MKLALGCLLAVSLLVASCATRNPGTVVTVTRNRETVSRCAFLGDLKSTGADERGESVVSLQKQTAERGGNVLLLVGEGIGSAYRCDEKVIVSASNNPTPARYPLGPAPTVTPTGW